MATRVEVTTRNTMSDILNEGKSTRPYISPLSDASNKSSDSSISSSLFIEENIRVTSKPVSSMFKLGMKPRLTARPFTRDKSPENRRSIETMSALSEDMKSQIDVPFQTSTSMSLSGSTKTEDHERKGRRIFTSNFLPDTEDDQVRPDVASIWSRKQPSSPSWTSTNIGEFKLPSPTNEPKLASKPPLMSRKPDVLQPLDKVHAGPPRRLSTDATDEQKETPEKARSSSQSVSIDSQTVRAQLRPKRRPVSAMFLDSVSDQTSDSKPTEVQRPWNRRPLSEDLTSLFESGGPGNKSETPFEETKENRPLTKSSVNSSITEDQSDPASKVGDVGSVKSSSNETRTVRSGISSRTRFSVRGATNTDARPSTEKDNSAEVHSVVSSSVKTINNDSKAPDNTDNSEVKDTDGGGITPRTTRGRMSLYLANTSSLTDSPTRDKPTLILEKKTRAMADEEVDSGRQQTASQYQSPDVVKKYSISSNVEPRSEKTSDKVSVASQDIAVQKAMQDWRTNEFLEDKRLRPRSSFKKVEEPFQLQLQDNENVFNERKNNVYKEKLYNTKTEEAEDKSKPHAHLDNTFRTVKATMFDHNVERHNPPELLSGRDPITSQPSRSDIFSEITDGKKDTGGWSKWLRDDSVHSVTQLHRDLDLSDTRSTKSKATTSADQETDQTIKVDEKRRIEPRFEVTQAVVERASSESIHMAPESKASTLRSRRSFHRKEKESENTEVDADVLPRPKSSLHRSKSEHWRRDTSSQENPTNKFVSKDLDFSFSSRSSSRTAKSDSKVPDNKASETGMNNSFVNTTVSDFQPKSYRLDKLKKENASEARSLGLSPSGVSATDSRDVKNASNDLNPSSQRSFNDLVRLETKTVKKEQAVSNLEITESYKITSLIDEFKMQSYQQNRFSSDKPSITTKKENKDESNYLISEMLSNEVQKVKKDLSDTRATKDTDFLRGSQPKEEYTEEFEWERKKTSFQDRNTSRHSRTGNALDLYNIEYMGKQNISVISPTDTKATYFAVTGLDNKKEKNNSNFESQSSDSSSWESADYFKPDVKKSTTDTWSDYSSKKPEAINTQGDLGTSSAFKEVKTQTNQRVFVDNVVPKPAASCHPDIDAIYNKLNQKPSQDDKMSLLKNIKPEQKISDLDSTQVVTKPAASCHPDIDAIYNKLNQKPSQDDKMSLIKDTKREPKISDLDSTQGSSLKLERFYKSKAVDIDSIMADYNRPKERISRDKDYNISKFEKSKSFRESVGSKWRDPSVRHLDAVESYPYESVGSWYSSQTTTSTEGSKQDSHKMSSTADHRKSLRDQKYEQYRERGRELGLQSYSGESQNKESLDSSQASPPRSFEKYKSQSHTFESHSVTPDWTTSHTLIKTTVVEKSVDNISTEDPFKEHLSSARVHHRTSVKSDRKLILAEERKPPSEGKRPAKATDLIALMLQNKEKRMEHYRSSQNVPAEQYEPRTQRLKSQQESHHSESKGYLEKESSRPYTNLQREPENVSEIPRRKSLNRHREWDLRSEDHVKQCFSRSSTSNKDTDSLVQDPDRQYGTWSQDKQQTEDSCVTDSPSYDTSSRKHHSHSRLSSLSHTETDQHDSITEARDGSLDRCSMDLDSTEGTESTPSEAKSSDFSFIDQTPVLDLTAQKNRVDLRRKSQRRAPSQLQRRSRLLQSSSQLAVIEDTDNLWMYTDSTEEKPEKKEEVEEEEEKPQRTSVHSPRMPMFPGMDHSTLMAQLRKKQDAESSSESSPQVTKSPKSPLPHGTLGIKLLPTPADKQDKAAGESPQWLKELKSKKRQSQYENHS